MRPHEFDFLQIFSKFLIILGSVIAALFAGKNAGDLATTGALFGFVLGVLGMLAHMKINDYLLSIRGDFEGGREALLSRLHFAVNAVHPILISATSFFLVRQFAPLMA